MQVKDYAVMTANEMVAGVRSGALSPVELVQAALAAIERTDPALNAWCDVLADAALARAAALETEARRGVGAPNPPVPPQTEVLAAVGSSEKLALGLRIVMGCELAPRDYPEGYAPA